MTNVVEFVSAKAVVEKRLDTAIKEFEALYIEVNNLFDRLQEVQELIDQKEVAYNMNLLELANIVGLDNLPEHYAEYASNVTFWLDDETGKVMYEFVQDLEGIEE